MDIKKVIKGLETIKQFFGYGLPSSAEIFDSYYGILNDAIVLLKEQETKTGKWIPIKSPTGVEAFGVKEMTVMDVCCSICGSEEDVSFTGYKYCPRCGAKMEGR